jgi:hypothetical protein
VNTPAHTVIYTHGGGRLGNQVLRFAHWIAWARTQPGEVEVLNLAFWPYARFFAEWQAHPGCLYPVRGGWADRLARWRSALPGWLREMSEKNTRLPRVVQAAGHWWPGWGAVELDIVREESADLADPRFCATVTRHAVTTCCGWKIASWPMVATQQSDLRPFFRPAVPYARPAEAFIGGLRAQHDLVVGVFIRQSDYREWNDGRFWFPTTQYAAWIRQLLDLHPGRRVAFVVASEVRQDPAVFAGLPVHFATGSVNAGGPWFESWVELSLCDFIVSPPSTFSATAAWLGAVPLWPVGAADQVMAFNQLIGDGLVGAARHPVFSLAVK